MIKNSMKLTFVAATLAGMSVGAHAPRRTWVQ